MLVRYVARLGNVVKCRPWGMCQCRHKRAACTEMHCQRGGDKSSHCHAINLVEAPDDTYLWVNTMSGSTVNDWLGFDLFFSVLMVSYVEDTPSELTCTFDRCVYYEWHLRCVRLLLIFLSMSVHCVFLPKKRAWSSRGRCKAQSSLTLWSTTISVMNITAMLHLRTNTCKVLSKHREQFSVKL